MVIRSRLCTYYSLVTLSQCYDLESGFPIQPISLLYSRSEDINNHQPRLSQADEDFILVSHNWTNWTKTIFNFWNSPIKKQLICDSAKRQTIVKFGVRLRNALVGLPFGSTCLWWLAEVADECCAINQYIISVLQRISNTGIEKHSENNIKIWEYRYQRRYRLISVWNCIIGPR